MENNQKVKDFYKSIYNEDEREAQESLEFIRSKNIIARYLLTDTMDIADIGGATGAYSFWLAKMGHRIHLLDLAPNHIEIAKKKSQESGIKLASYTSADARELPYDSQSMDMVLLMGAMYHLHTQEARLRCLTEAYRVLKPGGLIICTVMNRFNSVVSPMKYKIFDSCSRESIINALDTGIHEKANFYAHTPDEIRSEMSSAKFESIKLIAVEGIGHALYTGLPSDEREYSRLFWTIELSESIPELMGVSRNIMAVGKKSISVT